MPATASDSHEVYETTPQQRLQDQSVDDSAHDHTTIELNRPMVVSEEDAGADPYNRTGKFRRMVR